MNESGSNIERTNIEITKLILRHLGKGEELIKYVTDRPGHDRRYSLDCAKLKSLGWQPEVPFEEGLRQTVEWYVQNESWWRRIKEGREYQRFSEEWYTKR